MLPLVLETVLPMSPAHASVPFSGGDVFVGEGTSPGGIIGHYDNAGNLKETLNTGATGSYDTGMCFDASGNLYATNFSNGTVTTFNSSGNILQSPCVAPITAIPSPVSSMVPATCT